MDTHLPRIESQTGGRKLEHMVRYSGCICFDLDDVLLPPEQILSQAAQLGYVKAGHISPSHTGNNLFVLVDSDQEHHLQAFEQVRAMIEKDLPGVTVDISGKDANRGCFASYDPDAFYKEVADGYRRYRSSHGSNPWCPPTASTGQKSLTSLTSLTPISENPPIEGDSPLGFDIDPDEVNLPHFDRVVIDRFPGLLSDVLKVAADDREYDLMVLSSLTVLSTIMPGVSGMLKKQL